ncbi:MAG: rod shape-determining protein MreD [Nitrospirae bacterium]|nr:rod shape-determining protein MreD [Nitrospirota bacterium]
MKPGRRGEGVIVKTFLIYSGLAYLALAIQGLLFTGTKPDLVLVLVCFYSARHEQGRGMAYGAFTGLLIDVSGGFIVGPNIVGKTVAAVLTRTVRDNLFEWNIVVGAFVVAALSVIDLAVVNICYETFSKISFVNRTWGTSVAGSVYTVAAAAVMFPLFNRSRDALWH